LFDEAGKVGEIVSTICCPVIRLPGDVDTYRAGLGRSRRYTLQRKIKCLQGAGRIEYSRATSPADVDTALDCLITLHQRRWGTGLSGGVFASERSKRFHKEIVQVLSERGGVSIDLLKLDDRPLAAIYGFIYQGVYYFYLPGFDPVALFHKKGYSPLNVGYQYLSAHVQNLFSCLLPRCYRNTPTQAHPAHIDYSDSLFFCSDTGSWVC
jgi:hypothetical protein